MNYRCGECSDPSRQKHEAFVALSVAMSLELKGGIVGSAMLLHPGQTENSDKDPSKYVLFMMKKQQMLDIFSLLVSGSC
jgi:hypothetical protein